MSLTRQHCSSNDGDRVIYLQVAEWLLWVWHFYRRFHKSCLGCPLGFLFRFVICFLFDFAFIFFAIRLFYSVFFDHVQINIPAAPLLLKYQHTSIYKLYRYYRWTVVDRCSKVTRCSDNKRLYNINDENISKIGEHNYKHQ